MKNKPLVSIALCVYNGSEFLEKQLESIVGQTYSNLEIVAIDDLSTDASFDILKHHATTAKMKFRVYQNDKRLGFVKNFERAISFCDGEYIALCDQDDIWDKKKIEILEKNIGDNVLIYHDSIYIDRHDKKINDLRHSDVIPMFEVKDNIFFLRNNCVAGHSMMFNRELIKNILPIDARFFHDWWIAFVATTIGEIKFIDEPLVYYRQHETGLTSRKELVNISIEESTAKNILDYNLDWLRYLKKKSFIKSQKEISYIIEVIENYNQGIKGWKYFYFLVKYHDRYMCTFRHHRSFLSRLNYFRKLYAKS